MEIGKQQEGSSHYSIKEMALQALATLPQASLTSFADIGSGNGSFARLMAAKVKEGILLDASPPADIPAGFIGLVCDLNHHWPLPADAIPLAIALEVIEHLENPRHFFRELHRIIVPGGYAFISTPYNLNLIARFLFLFKGQHRFFQDYSYPAHITALLPIDIQRMANETGFRMLSMHYNYLDVLPGLKTHIHIRHRYFSNSVGFLLQKYQVTEVSHDSGHSKD
jgi:SAM-dependent methyltransferase